VCGCMVSVCVCVCPMFLSVGCLVVRYVTVRCLCVCVCLMYLSVGCLVVNRHTHTDNIQPHTNSSKPNIPQTGTSGTHAHTYTHTHTYTDNIQPHTNSSQPNIPQTDTSGTHTHTHTHTHTQTTYSHIPNKQLDEANKRRIGNALSTKDDP
jgi:hypothetical protein